MHSRWLAGALVVVCLLTAARVPAAADDATWFRVFLKDGTSLVSYGEFARVGERVVFSMPTSAAQNPPLHLVNLPADRIDWDRTDRYAASARAAHYLDTQAANDYAALSNQIAQTLNAIAITTDPAQRLAIVERARKSLAEWPSTHYNYRSAEVRQMLTMLDEAIADLRAASGVSRFDLNLSAFVELPPAEEPLLPPPTAQEAIAQTLTAARLSESPAERTSLLDAAIVGLDRDKAVLPAEWVEDTRASAAAQIDEELKADRDYQKLTARIVGLAQRRAKAADVRGVARLLDQVKESDAALGGKRPASVNALVQAVQAELDAARELRLAQDRWALRTADFKKYVAAMKLPMALFAQLTPALEDIKALAGSTPEALMSVHDIVSRIVHAASAVAPPPELKTPHALLVSAAQLADNAARIRREAALAGDMARAWDASSAAAGALMLEARARADVDALISRPQAK